MRDELNRVVQEVKSDFLDDLNQSTIISIFLCGAKSGTPEGEIRLKIGEKIQGKRYRQSFRVYYPEKFYIDLVYGPPEMDLLTLENHLAKSVHVIVILLQSPGTIAELGAFSNHNMLNNKLLVINDAVHQNGNGFINHGLLRFLKNKTNSKVLFRDIKNQNITNIAWEIVRTSRKMARSITLNCDVTNPIASYNFFLALLKVLCPIKKEILIDIIEKLAPENKNEATFSIEAIVEYLIKHEKILEIKNGVLFLVGYTVKKVGDIYQNKKKKRMLERNRLTIFNLRYRKQNKLGHTSLG